MLKSFCHDKQLNQLIQRLSKPAQWSRCKVYLVVGCVDEGKSQSDFIFDSQNQLILLRYIASLRFPQNIYRKYYFDNLLKLSKDIDRIARIRIFYYIEEIAI